MEKKFLLILCSLLAAMATGVVTRMPAPAAAKTAAPQSGRVLAFRNATVIDGTGAPPWTGHVLVDGSVITAAGPRLTIPADAVVIEARGMTLMPGMFDLHTHLPYATGGRLDGDWPKNLRAYLYCGITTVVDFGTYPEAFASMRRLIGQGIVAAPRLHLAARISTPGGHGAEGGNGDFFSQEVTTPREGRAAVLRVLPYKPDVIKVFTDGWRYNAAPDMTSMREDTLAAIVEEAHKHEIEVLTHTVTAERAASAARAGVDVIAHSIGDREVDQELIRLLREKGTFYAGTLAVYEPRSRDILTPLLAAVLEPAVLAGIRPPLIPPGPTPLTPAAGSVENGDPARMRRWDIIQRNIRLLRAGGVRLATGTDAGVTGAHHGWSTLRELQLLVKSGLTPLEALTAATGTSAKALKVDHERGTIAAGKKADLVLIAGAPHQNIADIEKISRVFLDGIEVDRRLMAAGIARESITPIPSGSISALLDDFEETDKDPGPRSRQGALWLNGSDSGVDATRVMLARRKREGTDNHALSILARMAEKDRPYARAILPLMPGGMEPVDARHHAGIQFEARGDGEYRLLVRTRYVRNGDDFQVAFTAGSGWQTIRIPFADLRQRNGSAVWTGDDLLALAFEFTRAAGKTGWLELDNIRFMERESREKR
ncbi:MAG: CIA30 family protein [Blastocatellia bacterium]